MVPVGEAKGAALALMVELLAAGLTGANYAAEASSFLDDEARRRAPANSLSPSTRCLIGGPATVSRFGALAEMIESEPNARLPGQSPTGNRAAARKRRTGGRRKSRSPRSRLL